MSAFFKKKNSPILVILKQKSTKVINATADGASCVSNESTSARCGRRESSAGLRYRQSSSCDCKRKHSLISNLLRLNS